MKQQLIYSNQYHPKITSRITLSLTHQIAQIYPRTHDKWIEFGIEDTNIETYLAYSQHSHQDHVRENEKERVQFDSSENNKATITSIPKIPSLPICTNKDAVALLTLTEALE